MKQCFAWFALVPPSPAPSPAWLYSAARVGVYLTIAGGFLQVLLGFDQGVLRLLPIVASALLFGLPHGAIDHLVALGLAKVHLRLGSLLIVASLYLALALLFALLWWLAPALALTAFLLITIYHWGTADTAFERILHPDNLLFQSFGFRSLHGFLRGLTPIGMPLVAFPNETEAFLLSCTSLFSTTAPDLENGRLFVGVILLLLLLAELVVLMRNRTRSNRRLLLESLALAAFFFFVPPLIAIGWYFCLWHGLRHVLRLCRYQTEPETPTSLRHSLVTFFIRAFPFTVLSLVFLYLASWLIPTEADPERGVALYLVLISTLTFPHMLLVEWMDRKEFWHVHSP